jgi:threonine/homoserine/homoserine lactone efflux protein
MAMTLALLAGYGLFAAAVRQPLISRPRIGRRNARVFAVSFVALGAKLAATTA